MINWVEIKDDTFLGTVRLVLSPQWTILVGRNGVGKSVFLEKIVEAASIATDRLSFTIRSNPNRLERLPKNFKCEIVLSNKETVTYEYNIKIGEMLSNENDIEEDLRLVLWNEQCLDSYGNTIWKVSDGVLSNERQNVERIFMQDRGLLSFRFAPSPLDSKQNLLFDDISTSSMEVIAKEIRDCLLNFSIVKAGLPRNTARSEEIQRYDDTGRVGLGLGRQERVSVLANSLIRWNSRNEEIFNEFVEIAKKLEIVDSLSITNYSRKPSGLRSRSSIKVAEKPETLVEVLVDGVNIGMISDGILRILEIIRYIVLQNKSGLLIIEEPETGIHPGLLSKILSTIQSYSFKSQIILSSHSPSVVNYAKPSEIRFMDRKGTSIKIHTLSKKQIKRLNSYLNDDYPLSDFIYSGEMDA
jgi:predicted ATPase